MYHSVVILYPKGKLMSPNTFLILVSLENHSFGLCEIKNESLPIKKMFKLHVKKLVIFSIFEAQTFIFDRTEPEKIIFK